jgi:hypothetical protein
MDGESFRKIMALLIDIQPPIRSSDKDKMTTLGTMVSNLSKFLLSERTSLKRVSFLQLSKEERESFLSRFRNWRWPVVPYALREYCQENNKRRA